MEASGRYARGSVLSAISDARYLNAEFSHTLYREVVLTSWDRSVSDCERDHPLSMGGISEFSRTLLKPPCHCDYKNKLIDHQRSLIDSCSRAKLSCYPVNHTGANPQNNPKTNVVAIIPARFASTRLPGKALIEIAGKPMVCWVAERALAAHNVGRVIVATDNYEIFAAVQSAGYEVALTRDDHASGTDRIAEVVAKLPGAEIVVNVQGDEPLISPETIERAVDAMVQEIACAGEKLPDSKGAGIVTAWEPIDSIADVLNPALVKIVVDESGRAIYFSRSPVPYPRDAVVSHGTIEAALRNEPALLRHFRKHTGLYVFRREVLLEFTRWPPSELERIEGLEQLRALERGVRIRAIEASKPSTGVDTSEDLEKVRRLVQEDKLQASGVKVRA